MAVVAQRPPQPGRPAAALGVVDDHGRVIPDAQPAHERGELLGRHDGRWTAELAAHVDEDGAGDVCRRVERGLEGHARIHDPDRRVVEVCSEPGRVDEDLGVRVRRGDLDVRRRRGLLRGRRQRADGHGEKDGRSSGPRPAHDKSPHLGRAGFASGSARSKAATTGPRLNASRYQGFSHRRPGAGVVKLE